MPAFSHARIHQPGTLPNMRTTYSTIVGANGDCISIGTATGATRADVLRMQRGIQQREQPAEAAADERHALHVFVRAHVIHRAREIAVHVGVETALGVLRLPAAASR